MVVSSPSFGKSLVSLSFTNVQPPIDNLFPVQIVIEAGDLLFNPKYWLHQVRSVGSPNIGVSMWFDAIPSDVTTRLYQ